MNRNVRHVRGAVSSALWLAGLFVLSTGCTESSGAGDADRSAQARRVGPKAPGAVAALGEEPGESEEEPEPEPEPDVESMDSLPAEDSAKVTDTFIQRLNVTTDLEENLAAHMRLPDPSNDKLKESLIRVVGTEDRPVVLFRSDVLAELGWIPEHPGEGFFTALSAFDSDKELERRFSNEEALRKGEFGETSEETVVFKGLSPVARIQGQLFDLEQFEQGRSVPASLCSRTPVSTTQAWGRSLLITAREVVEDPARTWDPCTGEGQAGGVWTFAHMFRQMAVNSGVTPELFALRWLETWLNEQNINGDVVAPRTRIFTQVIQPWATASGATATLVTHGSGHVSVNLTRPLDLDQAPFRLLAIVNRADLGRTERGRAGYGGTITSRPVDAGELRFVFGVAESTSAGRCVQREFTVILEYGVPITGCSQVVSWARHWLNLNRFSSFDSGYLDALEKLTERVVQADRAPGKGNGSALNQIRTNEVSLTPRYGRWELREFTLTDEDPSSNTDSPANGLLRPHTVAQSPDDGTYSAHTSAVIDAFVHWQVLPTVPVGSGPAPASCSSNYTVPYFFLDREFRGGNAFVLPDFWSAINLDASDSRALCARHQFSLNTCQGCHKRDTRTNFTHVKPTGGLPATLSGFLTGGGPGHFITVPDSQFPTSGARWRFADLDRRWRHLNQLALCTSCSKVPVFHASLLEAIARVAGVVPIDPVGPLSEEPNFEVGPIVDRELVLKVLELRKDEVSEMSDEPLDLVRPAEFFTH